MPNKVYINGKLVSEEQATVSVFDRSYLYGEGVFETMRGYGGRPAFCDMHYHRLKSNCEKLKIELPVDEYAFEHAVVKTINANKLKDAFIRVTVSPVGASMGLSRPNKMGTNVVIFVKQFKEWPKEIYVSGARVVVVGSVYGEDPQIAEIKSTSYLTKMMARMEVSDAKVHEGILQSHDGLVLEGTASNIFAVKKGRIFTPPASDGCLPGVTRWVIMGLAGELGILCKEQSIHMDDLIGADEIFLTNSTAEVMPVREILGLTKKANAPGSVTLKIMREYKKMVTQL